MARSPQQKVDDAAYRLAAIVESSDDVIVSKDLNGIVQSWNRAAERMLGFTAEEMIGQSITKIIPPDRLEEEDYVLSRIRAGKKVDHFETVRRRKDGSLIEVSLTVSPVRTPDGRIIGASKIARDITAQKQEGRRIRQEFVANMSHELRTPLHSIIGFTEVILDQRLGPVPPEYLEIAETVLASSKHLLQLINDILDLAKVDSGRIDFRPEPIDLPALLDEVEAVVKGLATKKQVSVGVQSDPSLVDLHLDPAKLKQVFYNYLSNAIKFTPEGGRVEVRTSREGDDAFRLEVEDTGIGVPFEQQHRLFVEFQQVDLGSSKRYQGTGLGLALTKRIVEAQGGRVGFESHPGEGSTFFAVLPRRIGVMSAEITAPPAATPERTAGTAG